MTVRIVTDSCCDLPDEVIKQCNLEEVAFMHSFAIENILAEARAIASRVVPVGKSVLENVLTPVMGTHVGPGSVGFAAITKVPVP